LEQLLIERAHVLLAPREAELVRQVLTCGDREAGRLLGARLRNLVEFRREVIKRSRLVDQDRARREAVELDLLEQVRASMSRRD